MILKDKVIMITGAGPGMGSKMAINAAKEGAKVAFCARSEDYIKDLEAKIKADGGEALAVTADVGNFDDMERFVNVTKEAFGRIDGLITSAYRHGDWAMIHEANLDDMKETMNVNLFGHLKLIQLVVPHMKEQGGGAICNVNTMSTKKPMPLEGSYATSKAAMAGATRMMAKELGPFNIRVNSTFHGWMMGAPVEMYIKMMEDEGTPKEETIANVTANIPLGVIPPDEDCANAVLFFLSDYSKMVTGAQLDVNGGEYMTG